MSQSQEGKLNNTEIMTMQHKIAFKTEISLSNLKLFPIQRVRLEEEENGNHLVLGQARQQDQGVGWIEICIYNV